MVCLNSFVFSYKDGGVTVYADDSIMNEKMQMAAKKLNIKGKLLKSSNINHQDTAWE